MEETVPHSDYTFSVFCQPEKKNFPLYFPRLLHISYKKTDTLPLFTNDVVNGNIAQHGSCWCCCTAILIIQNNPQIQQAPCE